MLEVLGWSLGLVALRVCDGPGGGQTHLKT